MRRKTAAVTAPRFTPYRHRTAPASEDRLRRVAAGLRLIDVGEEAGVSATRLSRIERDPSLARPGELEAVREAISKLAPEAPR